MKAVTLVPRGNEPGPITGRSLRVHIRSSVHCVIARRGLLADGLLTAVEDETLELDMYGGKHIFEGRISGFTYGTGSTLALLPPQNATGNFVKVVQRLPVRVDVLNYDPDKLPLFAGLSVTPTVDLTIAPTGPNAGQFLQSPEQTNPAASPTP